MPPDRILFEIGNLQFSNRVVLVCAMTLVFMIGVMTLSAMYWKRRVTPWAESERLQLVRCREAWFWEGPGSWKRSRSEYVFRVVTRDEYGKDRAGWVRFGRYWGLPWSVPFRDVLWDDGKA
jgi:hypothetical protein